MVKQPYRAPDAKCFIGNDGDGLVEGMLSTGCIGEKGYFDPRQVERLVSKFHRNPVTGFKDNMAFVGILSTQLIDQLFVRDFRSHQEIEPSLVRAVGAPEIRQE